MVVKERALRKSENDKHGGDDRNDDDAPGEEKGDVGGVDETGKQRRSRRRWSHLCFYLRFCSKNMLMIRMTPPCQGG